MLQRQHLSFLWERDSLDWKDLSAEDIYTRVTSGVEPGSIILFHNAAKNTPDALADIIEYLLAEGYEIVPVSELLLTGSYEIDHTGMMYASETA
jgi:peptidoglycan/xylan/chitin deacetylase (PgdA/CDA1 family)